MRRSIAIIALVITSCSADAPPAGQPASEAAVEPPTRIDARAAEAAVAALKQEPKVIDLVYDPLAAVEWTIGVKDDGSPRFGLAEYVCTRLSELGASDDRTTVRIVDLKRYMQPGGNGSDADLGTVECATGTKWER